MICDVPKVAVTTWSSRGVILVGPTYRQYLNKALDAVKNKEVASIIGQPGMGKTTILKKVEETVFSFSTTPFYLDLASKSEIEDEFWSKVSGDKVRSVIYPLLEKDKKKYGYSFLKKLFGVSFRSHLDSLCGKMISDDDKLLRLYCLKYNRDFDGMLKFIEDFKSFDNIALLIDEVRETHITKIHRLINSGLNVSILIAIPTDSYSRITDLAIRRRLDESRISLDSLTSEDIKEIVEAYCKPLSEEFFPIVLSLWKGRELNTVSSILQFIRSEVEKASKECGDNINCLKERIRTSYSLSNVEEDSKNLERLIRDSLSSLSKEFNISYVHPRGKRIEVKGKSFVVGLFFILDNEAYIGLVKLYNNEVKAEDEDVKLLSYVSTVEHDKKEYSVKYRFVVTNSSSLEVPSVVNKLEFNTMEVVRVLQGDNEILEEKVRGFLKSITSQQGKSELAVT
ncbi:ATP-binding protein [Sulfurisphaera ohwakuensis]|uniref:ATP-binding protein n=1 Tax=Sulfurisphaera ohwakuensis TaxID=69656 RepID=A0A650CH96_SULOH|nr:ATP-binding protein [Sulfurisphaera ohwakuensis]MBB5252664.1 energy-coupling factor transporter ATP-binding protein EcfA2 [Sulfurisphaera ohwakuensis]QGR16907.1 ATP-binding protein [Sulfurisphaera ohwakuensis]